MNSSRSDASTSTDDIKPRPLCLFYFSGPCGVLSTEPPRVLPADLAAALRAMERAAPAPARDPAPAFDLGAAALHRPPLHLARRAPPPPPCLTRDELSSSLFSSDVWLESSCSSRDLEYTRRVAPNTRILPPLELPTPRDSNDFDSSDDVWPTKYLQPDKFSLPPLDFPKKIKKKEPPDAEVCFSVDSSVGSEVRCGAVGVRARGGRVGGAGVRKSKRRTRLSGVRRMVSSLMQRSVKGHSVSSVWVDNDIETSRQAFMRGLSTGLKNPNKGRRLIVTHIGSDDGFLEGGEWVFEAKKVMEITMEKWTHTILKNGGEGGASSPAIQRALRTLRDAWTERRDADKQPPPATDESEREENHERDGNRVTHSDAMVKHSVLVQLPPRPDASPGLLHRRYSVPETIMRKYKLAQQNVETEEVAAPSMTSRASSPAPRSPPRGSCASLCDAPHRFQRRDREVMRKSALLRRLWGRAPPACACRGARSLDASASELRPLSGDWHVPSPPTPPTMLHDDKEYFSDCTYQSHRASRRAQHSPDTRLSDSSAQAASSPAPACSPAVCECRCCPRPTCPETANTTTDTSSTLPPVARGTTGSMDTFPDVRDSKSAHIDVRFDESSGNVDNDEVNVIRYEESVNIESPSYEVLEIVVSETLNSSAFDDNSTPALRHGSTDKLSTQSTHVIHTVPTTINTIDIDQYVSNILVESLNSLTDQLESMNASIGSERKISIVEKEIKVKLQNTGVNTIVHLSPTSNNQIIFGNEELYNREDGKDACNNLAIVTDTIREEMPSAESNNNLTASADTLHAHSDEYRNNNYADGVQHDNVNKAVLQQIQKLFQEELQHIEPELSYSISSLPGVSHVEISNVDVYIDEQNGCGPGDESHHGQGAISGVGAGNYYEPTEPAIVPRLSAFPHTDSMEVNTSSSDDAEAIGSDCTSLVDSLDNSPRGLMLRRVLPARGQLVRSAVDVLELLPESARSERREPEAFFVRISDDDCDCNKENVVVAERLPERIRARLTRRQRRREQRMQGARYDRDQSARNLERHRHNEAAKERRRLDLECMSVINALIDEVITKIAQEEYKYMRIKQKPSDAAVRASERNLASSKKNFKRSAEKLQDIESFKITKNGAVRFCHDEVLDDRAARVRGRLSLRPAEPERSGSRRVYQKSEIHEGNKCIEILEIIEYADTSQSSPETTNSDDNSQCRNSIKRKSKIPIPISERRPKQRSRRISRSLAYGSDTALAACGKEERIMPSALLAALNASPPRRRASVPAPEPRDRSNSLRFRQVFDIIPEEKSSLSIESSTEDGGRRVSLPPPDPPPPRAPTPAPLTRSACTSPLAVTPPRLRDKPTMTSPLRRSAATSPANAWTRAEGPKESSKSKGSEERKSTSTQYDVESRAASTVRTILSGKSDTIIVGNGTSGSTRGARPDTDSRDRKRPDYKTVKRSREKAESQKLTKPKEKKKGRDELVRSMSDLQNNEVSKNKRQAQDRRTSVDGEVSRGGQSRGEGERERSSSSESSGSLLCALAPRWLAGRRAAKRRDRTADHTHLQKPTTTSGASVAPEGQAGGAPVRQAGGGEGGADGAGWSVTLCGGVRTVLPRDVEMRLRFPTPSTHASRASSPPQLCACQHCPPPPARMSLPPAPAPPPGATLTLRNQSTDSSILASKSTKKSTETLPEVETYRASRSKTKRSVKTRRACSLHCWLPPGAQQPIRCSNGLSVLGCGIVPELRPKRRQR